MRNDRFYSLKKSDLQKFIDHLTKRLTVFAPVPDGRSCNFRKLAHGQRVIIDHCTNTEFPPKNVFLTEGEVLLEYDKGGRVSEREPGVRAAIFGIRPCDVHALLVLDKVMLGHDRVEPHYKKRRDNTLIIAVNCTRAGENCFCESMGTSGLEEGFDLLLTDQGNHFHVEAGSGRGEKLVSGNRKLFTSARKEAKRPKLEYKKMIDTKNLPGIMMKMFNSGVWEDVAKRCVSCASCTFSCPTCYCFNLVHDADIGDLDKGKVVREMDYCMLPRFSRVAGNVVFREPRTERVKQFFYHKLVYGKRRDGKFHCVGCGRCITECMAHIDITEEARKVRDVYEKR